MKQVFLYVRVSTEEQAIHGLSIEAQTAALEAWARAQGYKVVGIYTDAGISARKPASKRPELQRLLADVQAGKGDLIVFTKLDRWFRNIAEYYKVQEILERHHVDWRTISEDYDTSTAAGRLKINIMLSVAQDEADRTSERIKFVFDDKVKKGEAISGMLPMGLMIRDKHVVPNPETAHIVQALFSRYRATGSTGGAARYIRETYGVMLWERSAQNMLRNSLYKGVYRGNLNYCEPLIPPHEFDSIQRLLESRSVRCNPTGRVYLFAGLLVCANCGQKMSGTYQPTNGKAYHNYRCRNATIYHRCVHHRQIGEIKLEQWLLGNVQAELDRWQVEWEAQAAARLKKPQVDRGAIQRKLDRLKDLYVNDLISIEQYRSDHAKYTAQLQQAEEEPAPSPNFTGLRAKISDFTISYAKLNRESRREFWRGIIKSISLDEENHPRVYFCE